MKYFIPDAATLGKGYIVDSVAQAIATNIPAVISLVIVGGYNEAGDGGAAYYKRVALLPTHPGYFQDQTGAYFEICSNPLNAEMFGAVGDGLTDDSDAFNNCWWSAEYINANVETGISGKTYLVANITNARGYALNIKLNPLSIFKYPDGTAANVFMFYINSDGSRFSGGQLDGNKTDVTMGGGNIPVVVNTGDLGDPQISDVIVEGVTVLNSNYEGIRGSACKGVIFRNNFVYDTTYTSVIIASGYTGGLEANSDDCIIEKNYVDRSMLAITAEQGCCKIVQEGADFEINRNIIRNNVCKMPVTDNEYNGNVPVEMWGPGTSGQVIGNTVYGGGIGTSIANNQHNGTNSNNKVYDAFFIGCEAATTNNTIVEDNTVNGNGVTRVGVSLDYQLGASALSGCKALANNIYNVLSKGVLTIGPTVVANVYLGSKTDIIGNTISIYAASVSGPYGIAVEGVQDVNISSNVYHGNDATNNVMFEVSISRRVNISDNSHTGLAAQLIHYLANPGNTVDRVFIDGITNIDGAGGGWTFFANGGTFGTNFTMKNMSGSLYRGQVSEWSLASLDSATDTGVLTSGLFIGDPNGTVSAKVGSIISRTDGIAGTACYTCTATPNVWAALG